jgi:anti-anti-sigma factor
MTEAKITIEDTQSASPDKVMKVVHITGQLDESNIDEKIKEVYKVLEDNPKNLNLIFELEHLEYMNSKSIGYITDIYGKVTESLGQVAIAQARPNITDILQVVGLSQLIKMFATVDEAKSYLSNSSASVTLATEEEKETTPAVDAPAVAPAEPTPEAPVANPITEPAAPTPEVAPVEAEPAIEMTPTEPQPAPVAEPAPTPEVAPTPETVPAEMTPTEPVAQPETVAPIEAPTTETTPEPAPAVPTPATDTPAAPVTPEAPTTPAVDAPAAPGTEGEGTFNIG